MLALLLLAAITVKGGQAPLRDGCGEYDSTLAKLALGTPVEVRFAVSGFSKPCYKVSVTVGGKPLQGYLYAESLEGIESFEEERRNAPAMTITREVQQQASAIGAAAGNGPADHPLVKASQLLQQRQPRAALEMVERAMKTTGRDREYLIVAGIASYQIDNVKEALAYLQEAQRFGDDRALSSLVAKLSREVQGDKSSERMYGNRFLLRYEGGNLDPDVARNMVSLLEQEYARVSATLGCNTDDRIVTIIQSREAYRAATDAAEWSGGLFDGKIRVPVIDRGGISAQTRITFAHEITHACLASIGNWPAWLHEGLAQKMSSDSIPAGRRAMVESALLDGRLPRLANMGQTFARMSSSHANLAYAYSFVAVEKMLEHWRNYGLQNILRMPERFPQITEELDKLLATR